jgi:hypothetical protein
MAGFTSVYAQNAAEEHEISSSVPELSVFHKIIRPMWHTAYPAKDMAALKAFVPQIKEYMTGMNAAKLPGILREKESAWKSELVKFNAVAEEYYKAAAGTDDAALLKAAEKLHMQYEAMNRVIKPFVKEMDDYHKTLYVIYHYNLPENKFDAIAASMETFVAQADAITKYPQDKLEKRLKEKTPKYYERSTELYKATVALSEVMKGKDVKKQKEAIENVHKIYQKLEAVFE